MWQTHKQGTCTTQFRQLPSDTRASDCVSLQMPSMDETHKTLLHEGSAPIVLLFANSPIDLQSGTGMVSGSDCVLFGRSTKIAKTNNRTASAYYSVIRASAWTLKLNDIRRPRPARRYKNSEISLRHRKCLPDVFLVAPTYLLIDHALSSVMSSTAEASSHI